MNKLEETEEKACKKKKKEGKPPSRVAVDPIGWENGRMLDRLITRSGGQRPCRVSTPHSKRNPGWLTGCTPSGFPLFFSLIFLLISLPSFFLLFFFPSSLLLHTPLKYTLSPILPLSSSLDLSSLTHQKSKRITPPFSSPSPLQPYTNLFHPLSQFKNKYPNFTLTPFKLSRKNGTKKTWTT